MAAVHCKQESLLDVIVFIIPRMSVTLQLVVMQAVVLAWKAVLVHRQAMSVWLQPDIGSPSPMQCCYITY